jgi:MFS family permease
MLAGAAIFAVGARLRAGDDPALLAALRLLSGAGEALFFVGMVTAFTDLAPAERRGEAMSLASLALYLGIGWGRSSARSRSTGSGFTAAWLLAAGAAACRGRAGDRVPETRHGRPGRPGPGPAPGAPGRAAAGAGAVRQHRRHGGLPRLRPAPRPRHRHDGLGDGPAVFAGTVVAIRSVGARLPDVLGPARAIRVALVLSVVGLVLVGVWHTPAGLHLGAVVFGVGIALLTPSVFALAVAGGAAERTRPGDGHHLGVHRHRLRRRAGRDGVRGGGVRPAGGVPRRRGRRRGRAGDGGGGQGRACGVVSRAVLAADGTVGSLPRRLARRPLR